jgi:FSR family fosmidomycin resistance protein-like MFS transporter
MAAIVILWNVGLWYKHHGLARAAHAKRKPAPDLPRKQVLGIVAVLMVLMFSKQVYLAGIGSYYTFFLIHRFGIPLQSALVYLFLFLGATAVGTIAGGLLGDRFGRRYVIWFSILGTLPFTLALPYANLFWTGVLSVVIGVILASALPAILVYAQELMPGRIGMISGLFFGFAFGLSGMGAAALGWLADRSGIDFVYSVCSFLPALGLFAALLPDLRTHRAHG